MPHTGQKCPESGVYKCDKCGTTIPLSKDEIFPPCNKDGAVNWTLVRKA